jgi:hypothetical protein
MVVQISFFIRGQRSQRLQVRSILLAETVLANFAHETDVHFPNAERIRNLLDDLSIRFARVHLAVIGETPFWKR